MIKVAVMSTESLFSEKDLSVMSNHLIEVLNQIEGSQAERVVLTPSKLPDFEQYNVLVFCGYDHVTLSAIHLALNLDRSIIIYDEPGKAIERELNSVLFSGMDQRRIPPSSLSRTTHSWTFRDVTGIVQTLVRNEPRETGNTVDRARSVESSGKTQARKRVSPFEGGKAAS